jgi:preprotein translocase subunit SecF
MASFKESLKTDRKLWISLIIVALIIVGIVGQWVEKGFIGEGVSAIEVTQINADPRTPEQKKADELKAKIEQERKEAAEKREQELKEAQEKREQARQEALRHQEEARNAIIERGANAAVLQNKFYDDGLNIKVVVSSGGNQNLTLTFSLFNEVWVHKFKQGSLFQEIIDKGFRKVIMTDGFEKSWWWDL